MRPTGTTASCGARTATGNVRKGALQESGRAAVSREAQEMHTHQLELMAPLNSGDGLWHYTSEVN